MKRSNAISLPRLLVMVGCVSGAMLLSVPEVLRAGTADVPRLQSAAEHGSIRQQIHLGASYLSGSGVEQDLERAAYWYERAANNGDPLAQNEIGYFYQAGIGVTRNPERAAMWFQRASSAGYLTAKVNLGIAYLWGLGVRKDAGLAYELIHQAAVKNCGVADAYLGVMYESGVGVTADLKTARDWYERGAHLDDSIAEFGLAKMLLSDGATQPDLHMAARLLRKSIKGGYVIAQHSLGVLLLNHPELPASSGEPLQLFQNASNAGIGEASVVLGILYRDGQKVVQDRVKAYYYFRLAKLQGETVAPAKVSNDLAILANELPNELVASQDAEAAAWARNHPLTLQFQYRDTVSSRNFPVFSITVGSDDMHVGKLIPAPRGKA